MASNDSTLLAIASAGPVNSMVDLGRRLRALEAELDAADGLTWFNRWYAALAAALLESSRRHRFGDQEFVERLECHAADRYLAALCAHLSDPGSGPACWEPLFQARSSGVLPIQHAIAGINAHVNHDLPVALVMACAESEQEPSRDAHVHADFQQIGAVIDGVLGDPRAWLTGAARETRFSADPERTMARPPLALVAPRAPLDRFSAAAQLDDVLSIWSTKRACEAAWAAAEVRWALRVNPLISHHHLEALDRMVGLAGRSLLHPWQPAAPVEQRPSSAPSR